MGESSRDSEGQLCPNGMYGVEPSFCNLASTARIIVTGCDSGNGEFSFSGRVEPCKGGVTFLP